ncbi:MAG: extracellular solute-binding protein [bacterium]
MINKFLFSIALVFFFISTLSAQKEIKIWHSYRGSERKALNTLAESFNKEQSNYKVILLSVPYEAFSRKISSSVPRGNGPDGFIYAHERIGDWAESNIIEALSEEQDGYFKNKFIPVTVDALKYKGKIWGIPLAFKSLVLFYRSDMVENPPHTLEKLVFQAETFSNPEDGKFGLGLQASSAYFAAPFFFGFGGGFCLDGKKIDPGENILPCLDNKGNTKALRFLEKIVNEKKIVPKEATASLITQLFNEGRIPFVINGPWFTGEIEKAVPYNVAVLPRIVKTGKPLKPLLTVEAFLISAHEDAEKEGARIFAEFINGKKQSLIRAMEGHQAVAGKAIYEIKEVKNNPLLSVFRKQAENAVPMSNLPAMRMLWEPLSKAIESVLRGARTPEAALSDSMKEYKVFSKTLPSSQNPAVYIIIMIIVGTVGLWFSGRALKKHQVVEHIKKNPAPYLYLFPAAAGMFFLVFLPFAVGTAVAFFAHRAGEFHFVGFSNFLSILLSSDFPVTSPLNFYFTMVVTVMWTVLNVIFHFTFGLALALILKEPWIRMKGIFRVLLILPWAVPNYITALIWKGMFNRQFGAINAILNIFGMESVSWFSNFWTAFAANVATNTWLGFPFMMVTALGALQAIPSELEDAADVDGAGIFQKFRHVTLPLLKPAMLPAVILGSVWTFNMFNIIYLVSGGQPGGSTEILISESYKWAFQRQERYGYAAAYAVLIFIVLFFYSRFIPGNRKKST